MSDEPSAIATDKERIRTLLDEALASADENGYSAVGAYVAHSLHLLDTSRAIARLPNLEANA